MCNKHRKHQHFLSGFIFIFSTIVAHSIFAQVPDYVRPPVVSELKVYQQQTSDDSDQQMVELKKLIPSLTYDLRYATTKNFTHQRMYPASTHSTFMRSPAAKALAEVAKDLDKQGLKLKIFDAYRPYSVTVKFWELIRDERYVANPSKGSGHNKGIAIDLTLVNKKTDHELDLGTGFDNFSDTAHSDFMHLSKDILDHRVLLRSTMEKHGFKELDTEWWHFYFVTTKEFPVLDIDFKLLH